MRQTTLPYSEIGVIAATRILAGAGLGLLMANKMSDPKRRSVGWQLFAIGALSTIPLAIDMIKKSHSKRSERRNTEAC